MHETSCLGRRAAVAASLFVCSVMLSSPPSASAQFGHLLVTVTSPSPGSTVSGTTTVSAQVSTVGALTVRSVQFRLDGADVGPEDTSAPYAIPWNTTTTGNGSHTLTAVARDLLGLRYISNPVTVTVSNAPPPPPPDETRPSVAVTSPANGATVSGTIAARASASDNVGVAGVRFFVDGAPLGAEDVTAPYEVPWTTTSVADGSHVVSATARDAAGNTASSAVTVTVSNAPPPPPRDQTPPSVTVTSPANGVTVSGVITVTASASDNVGVAGIQFLIDGAPLGNEDTSAPYETAWTTTSVADGSHTVSAIARDAAGNTASAAATVTVSNAPPPPPPPSSGARRFENTDLSIVYTAGTTEPGRPGDWWHGSRSRDWSDQTASFNRSAGARAAFTFTGTSVSWIGFRAPWAGIARVYLDGVFVTELDLFAPTETSQVAVFSREGLAAGSHTLTVESTGRKHGGDACTGQDCSTDWAVVVDAFDVSPPSPPTRAGARIEEGSATYAGAWTRGDASTAWSGGTAAVSPAAGATATFTFIGTSVSWVGWRGPQGGIARVSLDGSFQAEVDTYASTAVQAVVYTATDLPVARHSVTIEATGGQNPSATSSLIAVDAVDVGSRVEERNPAVAYTGAWITENTHRAWSGTSANTGAGTAAVSATAGESAEFTFTGTGVSWLSFRDPLGGIADVWLNGVQVGRVDLYSASPDVRVPVFSTTGLSPGTHTLRVVVTGERNPAATGAYVAVDAFDVILPASAPPATRLQETAAQYSAGWALGNEFHFWSGERAMLSTTAGAQATFTFTGTSVRWIGERRFATSGFAGLARVSIDGTVSAVVDTRASTQEEYQTAVFSASGLSPGEHRLTIEVAGRNNESPGAIVESVAVDGLDAF